MADIDVVSDLGETIRSHQPTTGMAVTMGVTCRCGYWSGTEEPGKTRPVGYQGLQWHQAVEVAAYVRAQSPEWQAALIGGRVESEPVVRYVGSSTSGDWRGAPAPHRVVGPWVEIPNA